VADRCLEWREGGRVLMVVCLCTGNVTRDSSIILNAAGAHSAVG